MGCEKKELTNIKLEKCQISMYVLLCFETSSTKFESITRDSKDQEQVQQFKSLLEFADMIISMTTKS